MTILTPLALTQGIEPTEPTITQRWYCWDTQSGTTWSETPEIKHTASRPDYACDVTLPALMAGSPDEIRADIARELRRAHEIA